MKNVPMLRPAVLTACALILQGCSLAGGGYYPSEIDGDGTELAVGMRASPFGGGGNFGFAGEYRLHDVGDVNEWAMQLTGLMPISEPFYALAGVGALGTDISLIGELGAGIDLHASGNGSVMGLFAEGGWRMTSFVAEEDETIDPFRGPFVRLGVYFCFTAESVLPGMCG